MQTTIQQQQATKEKKRHFWQFWIKKEEPVSATPQVQSVLPTSFYEKAIEWTHRADKVVNLVLGYLLAVASVLGFMDVLSNGEVLSQVPWAFYVWLAIMGLGVDFQILLVIGRVPELARSLHGFYKLLFLSFNFAFLGFLAYMSVVIGAVFTEHRDMPVATQNTIGAAMALLHIDATNFVFQRAALATLLLVLMAVDRAMERWRMQIGSTVVTTSPQQVAQPVPAAVSVSDLDKVLQTVMTMNAQNLATMQDTLRQQQEQAAIDAQEKHRLLAEQLSQVSIQIVNDAISQLVFADPVQQVPQLPTGAAANPGSTGDTDEFEAMASLPTGSQGIHSSLAEKGYKEAIEALLSQEPTLSDREIAQRVGCSVRTANRWKTRVAVSATV